MLAKKCLDIRDGWNTKIKLFALIINTNYVFHLIQKYALLTAYVMVVLI